MLRAKICKQQFLSARGGQWSRSQTTPRSWDPCRIGRSLDLSFQETQGQRPGFPNSWIHSDFDVCFFHAAEQGALRVLCFTTVLPERHRVALVWRGLGPKLLSEQQ